MRVRICKRRGFHLHARGVGVIVGVAVSLSKITYLMVHSFRSDSSVIIFQSSTVHVVDISPIGCLRSPRNATHRHSFELRLSSCVLCIQNEFEIIVIIIIIIIIYILTLQVV
jgi:hypothetical protein